MLRGLSSCTAYCSCFETFGEVRGHKIKAEVAIILLFCSLSGCLFLLEIIRKNKLKHLGYEVAFRLLL